MGGLLGRWSWRSPVKWGRVVTMSTMFPGTLYLRIANRTAIGFSEPSALDDMDRPFKMTSFDSEAKI